MASVDPHRPPHRDLGVLDPVAVGDQHRVGPILGGARPVAATTVAAAGAAAHPPGQQQGRQRQGPRQQVPGDGGLQIGHHDRVDIALRMACKVAAMSSIDTLPTLMRIQPEPAG